MVSKAQKFRLGLFLTFTTLLLVVFLVLVAGRQIMEKRDNYFIRYTNISINGLQVGSSVKYYGLNIGRVEDINIDPQDINNVIVEISVKSGTPIKEDVLATLVSVGITGLKQVELTGGTNQAALLPVDSYIKPGASMMDEITGKAEIVAEKIESVLNNLTNITDANNQAKLASILDHLDSLIVDNEEQISSILENVDNILKNNGPQLASLIKNTDGLISENRVKISNIMDNIDNTVTSLSHSSQKIESAMTRLDDLLSSPELQHIMTQTAAFSDSLTVIEFSRLEKEINDVLTNLNTAIFDANEAFKHIDGTVLQGRRDLLQTIETLKETAYYLGEFSRQVNDDPSLLLRSKPRE